LNAETNDRGDYRYWLPRAETEYPLSAEKSDLQILDIETQEQTVRTAVSKGENDGEKEAERLGYTGAYKRRVVDTYKFSALNLASNYRVFDLNGGWNSTRASYFHKSLGGYHGAKLRNIQNLFDFHISRMNNKVFDMLNVKYFIQEESLRPNPTALGNAWFVRSVKIKNSPNDEIRALGSTFQMENTGDGVFLVNRTTAKSMTVYGSEKLQYILPGKDTMDVPLSNGLTKGVTALWVMDGNGQTNLIPASTMLADSMNSFKKLMKIQVVDEFKPSEEAVVLNEMASKLKKRSFSGEGKIKMTSYAPNKIVYSSESKEDQFAVFSEIYYPEGWKALVDGKEIPIIKTNYLLRGLELQAGKHTIEFRFDLPKFHQSNFFSLISSVVIFLILGILFYFDYFRAKRSED
jgi:hypothetical protein